ncbi:hypothetical protein SAMN02745199_0500 [Thermosipho atlanticus DSM 15807]|uniref:Uncharacterized protein n=1 Tax=Thermosipho atlanticus DSM 15807 TaxID=1123380 RepID=A0A1M5RME5_9BACT|nr:hypothetical protein SAMN02745199_0500 [Thermosipho atlanticus DSM 15807]
MEKIGPWIMKKDVNKLNDEVRKMMHGIITKIQCKEDLYKVWQFLHIYYIFSRTLKKILFV